MKLERPILLGHAALIGFLIIASQAYADARSDVRLIQRFDNQNRRIVYLVNYGERPVQTTVTVVYYHNGNISGQRDIFLRIEPKQESLIGGYPSSIFDDAKYFIKAAYYP